MKSFILSLVVLAMGIAPFAAFADCNGSYISQISRAENNVESGIKVAAYGVFFSCAPLPFAIGTTVVNKIEIGDLETSLKLLNEAEIARGVQLLDLYRTYKKKPEFANLTQDELAHTIVNLNRRNAFCVQSDVASYSDLKDIVEAELVQTK